VGVRDEDGGEADDGELGDRAGAGAHDRHVGGGVGEVHAVDEAGEGDPRRAGVAGQRRLHRLVVAATGLEHDGDVVPVAPAVGEAEGEGVERGRPLAAAADQHHGRPVGEAVGGPPLGPQGGPVEGEEGGGERHADEADVAPGREVGAGLLEGGGHVAGDPGRHEVGLARHGAGLVDHRGDPRHPGPGDEGHAGVAAHPDGDVDASPPEQPAGLERGAGERDRQERLARAGEGHHVDEVELVPGLGDEVALEPAGGADEGDRGGGLGPEERGGQRQAGEDVPAGATGGDGDRRSAGSHRTGSLPPSRRRDRHRARPRPALRRWVACGPARRTARTPARPPEAVIAAPLDDVADDVAAGDRDGERPAGSSTSPCPTTSTWSARAGRA
jgi:hypothetical protein